ncbi:hypothetical protein [Bacillus cereus group sp. BfR-BA-02730]|uniref:hypothetical protein n=1 Tax=Bacillus cereus group sp. BfR-BA-02730 TaxID=3094893 RepID=UPI0029C51796|nr:hypothetical protein [Bacillus cereus group sp. BfR-BA-02730]MDX5808234.1 hypothetical protein [Bacillus cereus group sp. BfR-BA-02730]
MLTSRMNKSDIIFLVETISVFIGILIIIHYSIYNDKTIFSIGFLGTILFFVFIKGYLGLKKLKTEKSPFEKERAKHHIYEAVWILAGMLPICFFIIYFI